MLSPPCFLQEPNVTEVPRSTHLRVARRPSYRLRGQRQMPSSPESRVESLHTAYLAERSLRLVYGGGESSSEEFRNWRYGVSLFSVLRDRAVPCRTHMPCRCH